MRSFKRLVLGVSGLARGEVVFQGAVIGKEPLLGDAPAVQTEHRHFVDPDGASRGGQT